MKHRSPFLRSGEAGSHAGLSRPSGVSLNWRWCVSESGRHLAGETLRLFERHTTRRVLKIPQPKRKSKRNACPACPGDAKRCQIQVATICSNTLLVAGFLIESAAQCTDLISALWAEPEREPKYLALGLARRWRQFHALPQLPLCTRMVVQGAWWDLVDDMPSICSATRCAAIRPGMGTHRSFRRV